jgi:hypothetical protein
MAEKNRMAEQNIYQKSFASKKEENIRWKYKKKPMSNNHLLYHEF